LTNISAGLRPALMDAAPLGLGVFSFIKMLLRALANLPALNLQIKEKS